MSKKKQARAEESPRPASERVETIPLESPPLLLSPPGAERGELNEGFWREALDDLIEGRELMRDAFLSLIGQGEEGGAAQEATREAWKRAQEDLDYLGHSLRVEITPEDLAKVEEFLRTQSKVRDWREKGERAIVVFKSEESLQNLMEMAIKLTADFVRRIEEGDETTEPAEGSEGSLLSRLSTSLLWRFGYDYMEDFDPLFCEGSRWIVKDLWLESASEEERKVWSRVLVAWMGLALSFVAEFRPGFSSFSDLVTLFSPSMTLSQFEKKIGNEIGYCVISPLMQIAVREEAQNKEVSPKRALELCSYLLLSCHLRHLRSPLRFLQSPDFVGWLLEDESWAERGREIEAAYGLNEDVVFRPHRRSFLPYIVKGLRRGGTVLLLKRLLAEGEDSIRYAPLPSLGLTNVLGTSALSNAEHKLMLDEAEEDIILRRGWGRDPQMLRETIGEYLDEGEDPDGDNMTGEMGQAIPSFVSMLREALPAFCLAQEAMASDPSSARAWGRLQREAYLEEKYAYNYHKRHSLQWVLPSLLDSEAQEAWDKKRRREGVTRDARMRIAVRKGEQSFEASLPSLELRKNHPREVERWVESVQDQATRSEIVTLNRFWKKAGVFLEQPRDGAFFLPRYGFVGRVVEPEDFFELWREIRGEGGRGTDAGSERRRIITLDDSMLIAWHIFGSASSKEEVETVSRLLGVKCGQGRGRGDKKKREELLRSLAGTLKRRFSPSEDNVVGNFEERMRIQKLKEGFDSCKNPDLWAINMTVAPFGRKGYMRELEAAMDRGRWDSLILRYPALQKGVLNSRDPLLFVKLASQGGPRVRRELVRNGEYLSFIFSKICSIWEEVERRPLSEKKKKGLYHKLARKSQKDPETVEYLYELVESYPFQEASFRKAVKARKNLGVSIDPLVMAEEFYEFARTMRWLREEGKCFPESDTPFVRWLWIPAKLNQILVLKGRAHKENLPLLSHYISGIKKISKRPDKLIRVLGTWIRNDTKERKTTKGFLGNEEQKDFYDFLLRLPSLSQKGKIPKTEEAEKTSELMNLMDRL